MGVAGRVVREERLKGVQSVYYNLRSTFYRETFLVGSFKP